ncbi:hypothetical protein [Rhodanobacter sp. C01]|uniref:hypothetical protein n=1 Tax=Rhodanobacter sp. C01 TaxID=1945856 RepID=UPI000986A791|nr:hypothetical protein [Rhodanobacter sp. C01]OOG48046.1 hypothetical protein B0E50_11585 [Rhodanobacter sp. C01]
MKRLLAGLALIAAAATLSGCYYDPGYVRATGYNGVYYTQNAYVTPGYYYGGYYGYYNGYYGCCYAPGVNLWYGGPGYGYYRGGYGYRGYRGPAGHWQGAARGAARGSVSHGSGHGGNHNGH